MTSDEVEDAVSTYLEEGHRELEQVVKRIRKMYKELGGEMDLGGSNAAVRSKTTQKKTAAAAEVEEADGEEVSLAGGAGGPCLIVTVEQFVGFVEAMAEKMSYCFDGYFDAFSEQYGRLTPTSSPETQQAFQMGMVKLAEQ